jgi:hypothetical protein
MISRASIGRPSWSWCGVVRGTKGGAGSSPAESEACTRHPAVDRAEVLDGDNIRYGVALSYASRGRFQPLLPFSLARRCRAGEWGFTSLRTGSLAPVPYPSCCAHLREDDGHIRRRCFRGRGIYCGIVVQDGGISTNLFCTSDPRQCDGREEGQQEPSRCQGEAAKTTEAGARARDHHDELFFGPKKALVKQISRFPAGLPRLCSCGPVLGPSWARCHSHRCCPCACNEVKRVDAAPPFHIRPRSSNPARSRARTSTTRARPTGGKTASARNARCQEIWQASSTYGGMIRYPPKLPTMCQNSKASKISCCPSILSRGHQ